MATLLYGSCTLKLRGPTLGSPWHSDHVPGRSTNFFSVIGNARIGRLRDCSKRHSQYVMQAVRP